MGGAGSAYCSRRRFRISLLLGFCLPSAGDAPQRHFFATGESVLILRARMHTRLVASAALRAVRTSFRSLPPDRLSYYPAAIPGISGSFSHDDMTPLL